MKEHQTKCGYAVECLREDGAGGCVGFMVCKTGVTRVCQWNSNLVFYGMAGGTIGSNPHYNLIEKPSTVRVKGWLNVYEDGAVVLHISRRVADNESGLTRIGCIEIDREVTHGEGLNDD